VLLELGLHNPLAAGIGRQLEELLHSDRRESLGNIDVDRGCHVAGHQHCE